MTSRVKKAVIPAAGLGTRFLPVTKATPKEMLPLIDTPTIQLIVEEAVDAGITDILIITSRHKKALEDHFDRNLELEAQLRASGKTAEADRIQAIAEQATFTFVRQGEMKGLGHAVGLAREHIGDEPFVVMLGDDVMHKSSTVLRSMVDANERLGKSVVALRDVPRDEIKSYGCADASLVEGESSLVRLKGIIEKPDPDEAPSTLAVMGRYVLTPDIFDAIDRTRPGAGGEIQLTDAMAKLIDESAFYGWVFEKGRFDIGKKIDFLRATVELALERDDVGPEFLEFLEEVVNRKA